MRVTELAGALLRETLKEGDLALDGTAGRGRDTQLLAALVGPAGRVHAFDVQPEAVESTRALLAEAGLLDRCTLHLRCHSEIAAALPAENRGKVAAAVFNLGYLPGSDHAVTTAPGTTLSALRATMDLLRPGGRLVCVCYTGHPGGSDEAEQVLALAMAAKSEGWEVSVLGREAGTDRPWIADFKRRLV